MADTAMHPALAPVAWLLGTWTGEGRGSYPTIDPFTYAEEARFTHLGKPYLYYLQQTRSLDDGRPMHSETGYWRPQTEGAIEVVLAQPSGQVEIEEGRVSGRRIVLSSTVVVATSSGKDVTRLARTFEVLDGVLKYEVKMAFGGYPLQRHLSGKLSRTD